MARAAGRRPSRRAAARALGIEELTPEQTTAIAAVERGQDALVVLPTGAGKSAIYQVAGARREGPTLVVSPLIALQEDQLAALAEAGLGEAAALHSLLPEGRRGEILDRFGRGELRYLFLAPEQLHDPAVVDALAAGRPGLLTVDESHCVVTWGNDFRPSFLAIGLVRGPLGRPPTLALTASAAPAVRGEIAERLGLSRPTVVVSGVERPNIFLTVDNAPDRDDAEERLVAAAAELDGSGLVYVARRADADRLAGRLGTRRRPALAYHSGLPRSRRSAVHERFAEPAPSLVVATVAFGLGIDKPDVRFVLHADAPESLDAWYQELGRAGRDGQPAVATIFRATGEAPARSYYGGSRGVSVDTCRRVLTLLRAAPPQGVTVEELGRAARLGGGRTWQAVVELVAVGRAAATPEGVVTATEDPGAGDDKALAVLAERTDRRRALHRTQGTMMRTLLDGEGCLWRGITGYLGEPRPGVCGHCDRCARGVSAPAEAGTTEEADGAAEAAPAPGDEITHRSFGDGTVIERHGDVVTVAFDRAGYRTLSAEALAEGDLLE